jgi:hypothetical protein
VPSPTSKLRFVDELLRPLLANYLQELHTQHALCDLTTPLTSAPEAMKV